MKLNILRTTELLILMRRKICLNSVTLTKDVSYLVIPNLSEEAAYIASTIGVNAIHCKL